MHTLNTKYPEIIVNTVFSRAGVRHGQKDHWVIMDGTVHRIGVGEDLSYVLRPISKIQESYYSFLSSCLLALD